MYVKQTPNLRSLTTSTFDEDMIDVYRWQKLITFSLPYVTRFNFEFTTSYFTHRKNYNIIVMFKQFQTVYLQNQHHWFVKYVIQMD